MSEFQYIGFRATEKPVSDKDLEFMRQQSSRAEITPWSFDNVYHFGDFRGDAQQMLRRGYDIHLHYANFGALIAAAAEGSFGQPVQEDLRGLQARWLESLPQATKDAWLLEWLADAHASARNDMLAEFRKGRPKAAWPTVQRDRTIAELDRAAEEIHQKGVRKAAETAARQRAKRLADMAADPVPALRETERLVKIRSRDSYVEIAKLLKDLREALAGTKQANLAEKQAQQLKKQNPTRNVLTAELRRAGFLAK
jgi:hypothetical protein